jgi:hypothetical protein
MPKSKMVHVRLTTETDNRIDFINYVLEKEKVRIEDEVKTYEDEVAAIEAAAALAASNTRLEAMAKVPSKPDISNIKGSKKECKAEPKLAAKSESNIKPASKSNINGSLLGGLNNPIKPPPVAPKRELLDLVLESNTKLKQVESLRYEIGNWLAEATAEPNAVNVGNRYVLPPLLNFKGQNNEHLVKNHLMAIASNKIEENHDKEDPFRKLLERMPVFKFPRTDTGFKNKILFAVKGGKMLEFGRGKLLEADTREEALVKLANATVKEEIVKLTKEEQKQIDLQNAPLNFSRNPRFISNLKQHLNEKLDLIAEPSDVFFTNYIPYKPYTTNLVIRNVSKLSHRFRVQYESGDTLSEFFRFKLIESPTKEEGLVASGLCCTYEISFTPNSLGAFSENLLVTSETGTSFSVTINAFNKPPELNLPKELDCGECRPGFCVKSEFVFTNIGGRGRFLIVDPDDCLSAFKLFDKIGAGNHGDSSPVTLGLFTVSPYSLIILVVTLTLAKMNQLR